MQPKLPTTYLLGLRWVGLTARAFEADGWSGARAALRGPLGASGIPVCCVRNGFADERTAGARRLLSCAASVPGGCHGGIS